MVLTFLENNFKALEYLRTSFRKEIKILNNNIDEVFW